MATLHLDADVLEELTARDPSGLERGHLLVTLEEGKEGPLGEPQLSGVGVERAVGWPGEHTPEIECHGADRHVAQPTVDRLNRQYYNRIDRFAARGARCRGGSVAKPFQGVR